jgi:hypothetical protein
MDPVVALAIRGRSLVLGLSVLSGSGCGDPMVPSDYSGPPAATVAGNVLGDLPELRNAQEPAFTMEWLGDDEQTNQLFSQPLQFARSDRHHEWNIGVEQPAARARIDLPLAASDHVRVAVGKMIYFDDGRRDRQLDWKCLGNDCDQVKAVSVEYVLFVERPPTCQPAAGGPLRARLSPGFHYYRLDQMGLREISPSEPFSFVPTYRSLADSNPALDLRAFADYLIERWRGLAFDRC